MPWITSTAMFVLAAFALGVGTEIVLVSGFQESSAQAAGFDLFRNELARGIAPVNQTGDGGRLLAVGDPVALLSIPGLGLKDVVVVEGTSSGALHDGPGHQRNTVLPGQAGVSIIMGRKAAYGGPFGDLDRLKPGMTITTTTGQGASTYRVADLRTAGDPAPLPLQAGRGRLTLITALGTPYVPVGVLRVDCVLVGDAQPASAIRAHDLPAAEAVMGTDPASLPVTVLWLQALIVAVLGAVWAWHRWGRWQAWVVFGPVIVLVVIRLADRVSLLLPNLT